MKQFEINGKTILAVEVPKDADSPWVINNGTEKVGMNWYIPTKSFGEEGNMWSEGIKLPFGSYTLLDRGRELTEEQWKGIIESCDHWEYGYMGYAKKHLRYVDYENRDVVIKKTSTESGHSWLKANNINPDDLLLIKT